MTPERWQEVKEVIAAITGRTPDARAAYLAEVRTRDPELCREVETFLAHDSPDSFLEHPAVPGTSLAESMHLGPYEIQSMIGEGGMGVLYRAVDTRLDRRVAIKVLRPDALSSVDRKQRFIREAKAASALNHPHIITIYEIDQASFQGVSQDFIVMEYLEGKPLHDLIGPQGLQVEEALQYAVQIADALSTAHEAGIVHRDIKPANIMVSEKGQLRVLDFGLAKLIEPGATDDLTPTMSSELRTEAGVILGTAAYMSPEQAEGKPVDARSDVFSFGTMLYEMLTGERPFRGDSHISLRMAVLRQTPPHAKALRPEIPKDVDRLLQRCLEKRREDRYGSGRELHRDLAQCLSRLQATEVGLAAMVRRPTVMVPATALLAATVAVGVWMGVQRSRIRWARNVALPEIGSLLEEEAFVAAFRLAQRARAYLPEDLEMARLWEASSLPVEIQTTPAGAEVFLKDYRRPEAEWESVGIAPMSEARVPLGYLRWRVIKEGHETVEGAFDGWKARVLQFTLAPEHEAPIDMVRVEGGTYDPRNGEVVALPEYWMDKYEVTNRQFSEFVEARGYQTAAYWEAPIVKDGQSLSFEQAMTELRDATGRPGPATWDLGAFPEGEAEFPVRGISWYEAAAYCQFAGKSLPTVHHWSAAAGRGVYSSVLQHSNFGGSGPAPVGTHEGLSPYGTYDMAGNVKEWCWNRVDDNHYILGGAWNEPMYMFTDEDAYPPFSRESTFGFRCASYVGSPSEDLTAPMQRLVYDFSDATPVDDETFDAYRSIYAYDRTELNSRIERVDTSSGRWRKETVSFDAAYGRERVIAHLYLPLNVTPPYQTVVYFPGSGATRLLSNEPEMNFVDFVPPSGRALVYPVYQGTHERRGTSLARSGDPAAQALARGEPYLWRDWTIQWVKDLRRTIDFLQSRDDIDQQRLTFFGLSRGATLGPIFLVLEPRFTTGVLWSGGFLPLLANLPGDVNPINFVPRTRLPILMVNGRYDFETPPETSTIPMFRLLGSEDKRQAFFDTGHIPLRNEFIKETLDWLDGHLGPPE